MAEKNYTLTQRNSLRGPVEDGKSKYAYEKGDIINGKQYEELIPRHKMQFEEGAIPLNKPTSKKDSAQDVAIAELTERVEQLEAAVLGYQAEAKSASSDEDPAPKMPPKDPTPTSTAKK